MESNPTSIRGGSRHPMTIPYLKGVDKVGYGVIRYVYIRGWGTMVVFLLRGICI